LFIAAMSGRVARNAILVSVSHLVMPTSQAIPHRAPAHEMEGSGGGRWPVGSGRRLLHAILLCVLQPAVPAATIAPFRRFLWTPDDTLARAIPLWVLPAMAASAAAVLAVVVGGGLLLGGLRPASIGWRREDPRRVLLGGVLGAVASTAALLGAVALFGGDATEGLRQMLAYSPSQRAVFALVGVSLALFEESLFRGHLQRELTARLDFPLALLLTAGVYAAYHFPLMQAVSVTARLGQGLVYGALRGRDRSLLTPALAHALCWAFVGLY
jgi:membrane protease YdiL (CAAX protease family)